MLHFQDPYFTNSYTLHEALIQSCSTSIQGVREFMHLQQKVAL